MRSSKLHKMPYHELSKRSSFLCSFKLSLAFYALVTKPRRDGCGEPCADQLEISSGIGGGLIGYARDCLQLAASGGSDWVPNDHKHYVSKNALFSKLFDRDATVSLERFELLNSYIDWGIACYEEAERQNTRLFRQREWREHRLRRPLTWLWANRVRACAFLSSSVLLMAAVLAIRWYLTN